MTNPVRARIPTRPACSVKNITQDSFYYVAVSGTKPTDAGAFKLTLTTAK